MNVTSVSSPAMERQRPFSAPQAMSPKTFERFREFVTTHLGIKMPDVKKTMLQSRLQKRLRLLSIDSYEDYYDYVFSARGRQAELTHMIDAVTTNKTDFFREPKHFDYLVRAALPDLLQARSAAASKTFRFWSAGCSTGAEPYTLGMVLSEFAERVAGFQFAIIATDISQRVLEEARAGIYSEEMAAPIPLPLRKKYLLRSKNPQENAVRINSEIRSKVRFGRLNFMEDSFGLRQNVDVIFCRNVLIYFDRSTQEQVVNRLCRHLHTGGFLFLGHSETLNGLSVPLTQIYPTIYKRQES
ncbi:MAG: protein-glutamate O-methyltransferase [Pseudomonadota bacterium]